MWIHKWLFGAFLVLQLVSALRLNPKLMEMNEALLAEVGDDDSKKQSWKNRRNKNKNSKATEEVQGPREPKYFQEPGQAKAGHYDKRFFTTFVGDEERKKALRYLIRAWLQWTQKEGIETWLAHGTLLGWWWNEKILPWDTDLDVQVAESTLKTLAEYHNMSTWIYTFEGDEFQNEYLLDVNPYWPSRVRGHSANLIDARWVDKTTGLFIDITGLSETHPSTRPNILSCKNLHRYHIKDIYPLRTITFENFKAFAPKSYDKALIKEYRSKALTVTEFEGHVWQPGLREWIQLENNSTIKKKMITLKNGRTVWVKHLDPRGLDAVPEPGFLQNLSRLIWYW